MKQILQQFELAFPFDTSSSTDADAITSTVADLSAADADHHNNNNNDDNKKNAGSGSEEDHSSTVKRSWFFPTFLKSIEEDPTKEFAAIRANWLALLKGKDAIAEEKAKEQQQQQQNASNNNNNKNPPLIATDGTALIRNSKHFFARLYRFHTELPSGFFIRLIYRICSQLSGYERSQFWKDGIFLEKEGGSRRVLIQMKGENSNAALSTTNSRSVASAAANTAATTTRFKQTILELTSIGKRSSLLLNQICHQIVEPLILEWYPGLTFDARAQCRCPPCEAAVINGIQPFLHNVNALLTLQRKKQQMKEKYPYITCYGPPSLSSSSNSDSMSAIHIADLLGEEELVIANEFLLKPEDVKWGNVLGSGDFGVVYRGDWSLPSRRIDIYQKIEQKMTVLAIKKPRIGEGKKVDVESWQEEAYLLR